MNNYNTPAEICDIAINAAVGKANMPILKMLLLGIAAGAFIAFGAACSAVAMHNIGDVGIARLVCGAVFPVGLMLIVMVGGELFTGNCLMIEGLMEKKISILGWLKNLAVVYTGNLIGSALIAAIVAAANTWGYTDGALGAFTIRVAVTKAALPFGTAFASGILCNVLVCGAVLMAFGARDIVGKILGIWFPIMSFVLAGFKHSIANMYYLFAGLFASFNTKFVDKAAELYNIGTDKIANLDFFGFCTNLVPVTLGNIVGGVALGFVMWMAFKSKAFNKPAT
ncbi:MAG: formate/nitrite transporter family protein [Coriobacteriales bacterium]|jgi:formate/nitrite transporter|nr:formate/nitrite transporter family protein [Coriobacteriales bacterium]